MFQEVCTMKSLHWRCEPWFDCVERTRRAKLPLLTTAPRSFAAAPSFQACLRSFICTFCMCVCIYVYVCACADMYICIYMHVCTYMYTYAFIHICMRVHMCVGIYICAIFCSECCMHFGTGVLGTSAWAGVYAHRCIFTPTYTSANTLAAGCVHMCIFI